VREERWVGPDDMGEPLACAFGLLLEALELAAYPLPQVEVNSAQIVVHRRFVEVTVVVDPTAEVGIDQPSQIIKGHVGPVLETLLPDFPTHRL